MIIKTLANALLSSSPFLLLNSILVLTSLLVFHTRKTKNSSISKQSVLPPGPVRWPIVGNLPEMLFHKPVFRWLHLLLRDMNTDIACVRIGKVHVIPISCPKIAQEVLRKQDVIFASRPTSFAASMFSGGYKTAVISPFGDQWKKMRRVLTSEIICPLRHRWLQDKRAEEADHLISYVYNQCEDSKNVDVRIVSRHYCGNVIRRLMFNKRYFGQPTRDGGPGAGEIEHIDALFDSLGYLYAFCISDYFPSLIGLDLDGHEKIVKRICKTFKKFHDPIVDERIQLWRGSGTDGEKREPQDFLDVLISLQDAGGRPLLSPDEIKAQSTVRDKLINYIKCLIFQLS
jgi:cytochrome P450